MVTRERVLILNPPELDGKSALTQFVPFHLRNCPSEGVVITTSPRSVKSVAVANSACIAVTKEVFCPEVRLATSKLISMLSAFTTAEMPSIPKIPRTLNVTPVLSFQIFAPEPTLSMRFVSPTHPPAHTNALPFHERKVLHVVGSGISSKSQRPRETIPVRPFTLSTLLATIA